MNNNTIQLNGFRSSFSALCAVVFAVGVFSIAPFAHAQVADDFGGDIGSSCCGDTGSYSTGVDYTTSPDFGSYSTGVDYTTSPDYMTSGYLTSSYLTGSAFFGGGYGFTSPGYAYSVPFSGGSSASWNNGNTYTYAPTQTNTCTAGNSCNTNIVTNTTTSNPSPVYYAQPYPVYGYNYTAPSYNCNTCGCLGYPVCPTVAYNNPTPYITLSQVPYTGLDLGFWGTIAYWGFFILWCLVAAYLIVVKKVQARLYRALNNFLFGVDEVVEEAKQEIESLDINALAAQIAALLNPQFSTSNGAPTAAATASQHEDKIDDFVLAQIHRPMR
jgi:hypothetical protein